VTHPKESPAEEGKPKTDRKSRIRDFFTAFGPGVITGAADDDPSGIATYSIAGARFGTSLLWTALLTWPLMAAVQMTCARIGMVTGRGLISVWRKKFPQPVLILVAVALLAANTFNIAADLAGMADAAEMLTGLDSHIFVVLFGVAIAAATIWLPYHRIAAILKWLALALGAYVAAALLLRPNWGSVLRDAFVPSLPKGKEGWQTLVAILGTTISPYLFFWQASQEVEEEKALGRRMLMKRLGATRKELIDRDIDVGVGTGSAILVMFFVMLTTALTLNLHGMIRIENSRQAAEALQPLAGDFAAALYTLGLFGVGFLAIPTLSGSAAYAFAETFAWREGLDQKPRKARGFYSVVIFSTVLGILFDFLLTNPYRALFWSAVLNGLLSPFLLVGILIVASDKTIMQQQPSSRLARFAVGLAALLMFAAAVGMFVL
jgi:NRAMP (natural resistance-associated macrophage protein)-like metal ion transporter